MLLRLLERFVQRGHRVDLLLSRVRGDFHRQIPAGLEPIRLKRCSSLSMRLSLTRAAGEDWSLMVTPALLNASPSWALRYLPSLSDYLSENRPDVLLSANSWPNLVALLARRLSGVGTRVVVSERVQLSQRVQHLRRHARWRRLPSLIERFYPEADAITAVSEGVADDLSQAARLARPTVLALPNPVVSPKLLEMAEAETPHHWLAEGQPPVILGVGRLHAQKDFPTLIRAFSQVSGKRPARLIILGEGGERSRLEGIVTKLGLAAHVDLLGHVDNPYVFMSRAAVFALSSRYEGLPGALIQALACGCPSVSTDCPSGPREIMQDGKLGPLVPVGDAEQLAQGIERCLDAPVPRETLQIGVSRYDVDRAADAYLKVLLPDIGQGKPIAVELLRS